MATRLLTTTNTNTNANTAREHNANPVTLFEVEEQAPGSNANLPKLTRLTSAIPAAQVSAVVGSTVAAGVAAGAVAGDGSTSSISEVGRGIFTHLSILLIFNRFIAIQK